MTTDSATPQTRPTLLLVDGHALAFRAFFAFAKGYDGGLRTSTGIPTSVSYGFLTLLLDVMEAEKPDYAAVAFDLGVPTFRHEADETYKAGRPETPQEFFEDMDHLRELLQAFRLPMLTAAGYEADDVLGTLARQASQQGYRVKILSGDQDLFQLIDPPQTVTILHMGSALLRAGSRIREYGLEEVKEKLGIQPSQVVDYKALCGDSSDNIPGVKGIGPKTAVQLLNEYGSLEGIYNAIDQIKGATQKKLQEGKDDALHSQYMAQIALNAPIEFDPEACKLRGFDPDQVTAEFKKLEFQSFLKRIDKLQVAFGGEVTVAEVEAEPSQGSIAIEDLGGEDLDFFTFEETLEAQQQPSFGGIQPQIIQTSEQLQDLVQRLQEHRDPAHPVAWDTETNALKPREADLVGIGCCWGTGPQDMAYIPVGHKVGKNLDLVTALDALRPILESDRYPKVLQNAKFDRLVLRSQGIDLRGIVFDPMLASYLLNPDASHNLGDLSLRYLGIENSSYTDLVPRGKTIDDIEIPVVAEYCGMDAYVTYQLVPKLREELANFPELEALLRDVELPLEPVLADMEYWGIRIDPDYLKQFSHRLEQDLAKIEQKAYEVAGETFNLGSPKQLSELLFDKLGLDKRKSRKTKTGYSTDAATLEKLEGDHPVIDVIEEHRTLSKLKSTYVDGLPALINPKTGRVHTDFNQAITATGRLSSSNPNLQNIPIRTAFSRQIRAAFIPQDGWSLISADYSQIELRILAHLTEEPLLVEAYRHNEDVHSLTARILFETEEITPEQRRLGKVINFGVIYGMGASRFAREASVPRSEAKLFIDRFNDRYPRVFQYLQQMQRDAIAHGYVQTIKGRRRYFNFTTPDLRRLHGKGPSSIDLSSLRPGRDSALLRAAANAPIQGSSADIIKIAMVRIHDLLQSYDTRLLLQVHDELVFEAPPDEWTELAPQIQSTMESAVALSVPLKVEVRAGQNWMDAK